jgi:hypothetical protein
MFTEAIPTWMTGIKFHRTAGKSAAPFPLAGVGQHDAYESNLNVS